MNILINSPESKTVNVVTNKKTVPSKIILGLGKKLAEIDYDTLFENKTKR